MLGTAQRGSSTRPDVAPQVKGMINDHVACHRDGLTAKVTAKPDGGRLCLFGSCLTLSFRFLGDRLWTRFR
jgi:hypothetical protein